MSGLSPAALAFDAIAPVFDARFGAWQSVAAQRGAVRQALLSFLPAQARVLELGGGTGEDARWLAWRGFDVTLTDPSPAMVEQARTKLEPMGAKTFEAAAEEMEGFADRHFAAGGAAFDAAFSNFAGLNCVSDLAAMARGLARLVRPGGQAVLVLFGRASPGEMLVECLHGRPRQALRRRKKGPVAARLGGRDFTIRYHSTAEIAAAMAPHFRLEPRLGIGIFVPPSAAEPWISRHPRLLRTLARLDRLACGPMAALGDHVLYRFVRLP